MLLQSQIPDCLLDFHVQALHRRYTMSDHLPLANPQILLFVKGTMLTAQKVPSNLRYHKHRRSTPLVVFRQRTTNILCSLDKVDVVESASLQPSSSCEPGQTRRSALLGMLAGAAWISFQPTAWASDTAKLPKGQSRCVNRASPMLLSGHATFASSPHEQQLIVMPERHEGPVQNAEPLLIQRIKRIHLRACIRVDAHGLAPLLCALLPSTLTTFSCPP